MLTVGPLVAADRPGWEALFHGYNAFYGRTMEPEFYDAAWARFEQDTDVHALGARLDGTLVGITHFLVHPSTTSGDVCYLQDLFTAAEARGHGAGRALITAVTDWARARACSRVYWSTHESNATARGLYDTLADNRGFILYRIDL